MDSLETQPDFDDAFDEVIETSPEIMAHSWQAWAMSKDDYLAGRTDLRARDIHFATYPNFPPALSELRARALRCKCPYVMLEHHAAPIGEKKKRISEDVKLFDFSQPEKKAENGNAHAPVMQAAPTTPAQTVKDLAEAMRVVKEEFAHGENAQTLTPEDIAQIAERAAIAAIEARERVSATQPASQQPDPFAFVERSLEIEEKMRQRFAINNPAPVQPTDQSEQFLNMFDKFTAIAERIAPIREADSERSGGTLNGIASVVREVGTAGKTLAPMIMPTITSLFQGKGANDNTQAHVNGAQQTSPLPVDPVEQTLAIIVDDLKKNRRVGRAADAIEDLFVRMPEIKEQVAASFTLPATDILAQLSQIAGEDLLAYSHAAAWIEYLKQEISDDEENGSNCSRSRNMQRRPHPLRNHSHRPKAAQPRAV